MNKRSLGLAARAALVIIVILLLSVTAFSEGIIGFAVTPARAATRQTLSAIVIVADLVLAALLFVTLLQIQREREFAKSMGRLETKDHVQELKQCIAQSPHLRTEIERAVRQSERIQQHADTLRRMLDRGSVSRFSTLLDAGESAKEGVEDNTLNLINLISICDPESRHYEERMASIQGILTSNDAILSQLDEILGLSAQLIAKKTLTDHELDCLIEALKETCATRSK